MKLLLDSHTLLWSIGKSDELSKKVIQELEDTNNDILVSAVSLWELALKQSIGKLVLSSFDIKDIPYYCKKMGFELIPLNPVEALESFALAQKEKHKDPFDRMLIYQCIRNNYIFVSRDTKNELYKKDGLKYIW
ncbi:PIN domain protein [Treponema primitia ZAS-2]|uniref:PIN domain protein n=1 Tax=Treponema primitia (strain ATCC BAA-887 / DSM 12427 / ZAS-2) TaxID=545694 RepID=F5YN56_TREPZ|nr:type II toxin-antitoxin system VapC family toxin [Treponema primitia]AEF84746.1 PIN domain protein [Treponema primitia ZAS-2]AEF86556.1 PIN domain protein [Treponema primitia ZAS-2]